MNDKKIIDFLLDSRLITRTNFKKYHVKIIDCNDYLHIYKYDFKVKKDKNLEEISDKRKIDVNYLYKEKNLNKKNDLKVIEYKNILRSKFNLQRLIKSNEKDFKTFITLTFAENINDISIANKIFANWSRQIRRLKPNFKYVCVPEFQKRGAVHYHLLTNLDIVKDNDIILPQASESKMYDVRFWRYGFSSVFPMKDINVVGYLSKYLTKDVDNRLFGKRRYFYSQNLYKPKEYLIDLDTNDYLIMLKLLSDKNEVFKNFYYTTTGEKVEFTEYK